MLRLKSRLFLRIYFSLCLGFHFSLFARFCLCFLSLNFSLLRSVRFFFSIFLADFYFGFGNFFCADLRFNFTRF